MSAKESGAPAGGLISAGVTFCVRMNWAGWLTAACSGWARLPAARAAAAAAPTAPTAAPARKPFVFTAI
jgi:hypothetical protein